MSFRSPATRSGPRQDRRPSSLSATLACCEACRPATTCSSFPGLRSVRRSPAPGRSTSCQEPITDRTRGRGPAWSLPATEIGSRPRSVSLPDARRVAVAQGGQSDRTVRAAAYAWPPARQTTRDAERCPALGRMRRNCATAPRQIRHSRQITRLCRLSRKAALDEGRSQHRRTSSVCAFAASSWVWPRPVQRRRNPGLGYT
jgi:hypothetical protein